MIVGLAANAANSRIGPGKIALLEAIEQTGSITAAAKSSGRADWDRVGAAGPMRAYWKRVTALTGMPYPNPMHLMLQSTDPLGAAVTCELDDRGRRIVTRLG